MKLKFSRRILEKYSKYKMHEKSTTGSRDVQCGPTDKRDEPTVAFRNSANASKTGVK